MFIRLKMPKILIATKNPGKLREIKEFLGSEFEITSLKDFDNVPEIEENGATFEENSLIKAKFYAEGIPSGFSVVFPTIADDGGLEIDFLNGEPGVKSRRWPGYEATDEELIDIALEKLKGVPWEKRTARLRTVGTYYDGKRTLQEEGSIKGYITEEKPKKWENGYPFRAILWIPKFKKLFQDLTEEEHTQINHRKIVYQKLGGEILKNSQNNN